MKNLQSFILEKRGIILYFLGCVGCFGAVFSLYDLALEAVLYAAVLCLVLGAITLGYSLWKRRKKLKALHRIKEQKYLSEDDFANANNAIETAYQQIIKKLIEENRLLKEEKEEQYRDMADYYTLWAHQIKIPIAAMRLLLQSGAEEGNSLLSGELFKIEQYVEMVLNYLRLESDHTDYAFHRCDLDSILKQLLRKYSLFFISKKLTLKYQPLNKELLTDEKWFSFIVEQLLSNAIKYTNKGSIASYLSGSALVIEDTGIGIALEDLPRVFDKGFTGLNGRADKRSTGIGLFLCKKISEKLGHALTITSLPGEGTKAILDLARKEMTTE